MKRTLILTAACLLLAAPASAQPPTPMGESDYFPLQKGTTWTYRAGRNRIIVKVVGEEKVGKETCSRLETSINGMVVASECITVTKDGVFRVKVGDQLVNPPLCFLKLPPKKGTTWNVDSKAGPESIKGTFKEDELELPAFWEKVNKDEKPKMLKMVTVTTTNMNVQGQKLSLTYTFAPGVGIVKQVATVAGAAVTLELEKFTAPSTMP